MLCEIFAFFTRDFFVPMCVSYLRCPLIQLLATTKPKIVWTALIEDDLAYKAQAMEDAFKN